MKISRRLCPFNLKGLYFSQTLIFNILSIFIFTFILTRCNTTSRISYQNLSYLYNKNETLLHPEFRIYHINDSVSRLYYSVNAGELLYARESLEKEFSYHFGISYKIFSAYESKEIIDSASFDYRIPKGTDTLSNIIGFVEFKAKQGNIGVAEVILTDKNRNKYHTSLVNIEKKNILSRQNFDIKMASSGQPLFSYNIDKDDTIELSYSRKSCSTIYVRYYKRNFPLASPPFSSYSDKPFGYNSDSLFKLKLSDDGKIIINLKRIGFYHILSDSLSKEGITLFHFYDGYPAIIKPEQLQQPLRYITTKQEYDRISELKNKKEGVDNFWLEHSGSKERAREMVKRYYNFVQDANTYFTSYLEGWKTDKGMIYIIFGPPTVVYKSMNSESWVYGSESNMNSLTLNFVRIDNPFSENDFVLNRSSVYKIPWFNAVEMWRR